MSAAAPLITWIEEVEEKIYPFPGKVIPAGKLNAEQKTYLWDKVEMVLDDDTRQSPEAFFKVCEMGHSILIDLCDGRGVAWLYSIYPGRHASISLVLWGNARNMIKEFGPVRDMKRALLRWLMDQLGLQKLRAYVMPHNDKAIKMAERSGFSHEGLLRREFMWNGELQDLTALSLLRSEL